MRAKGISLTREKHRKKAPWVVRWWGKYDVTTGKCRRYGRVFDRKKQAEDFIERKSAEFEMGVPRDMMNITLGELIEKFKEIRVSNLRNGTKGCYEGTFSRLKDYFGSNTLLKHIRREAAEQFVSGLAITHRWIVKKNRQLSDSARNRHLRESKTLFQAACDWHYIRSNPFADIKPRRPSKRKWYYITPSDFRAISDNTNKLEVKAIYSIMYGAGLRLGEAGNLLWSNVDLTTKQVNVVNRPASKDLPPFSIKDKQSRMVPLPNWVVAILKELKKQAEADNPFVFLSPERWRHVQGQWKEKWDDNQACTWENRMLMNHNLLRNFRSCCKRAGIKTPEKLNLHCLRKAYGTNLANVSTPVQTLKDLMGHSSIQTTMDFYVCSSDSNQRRATAELDRIMQAAFEEGSTSC